MDAARHYVLVCPLCGHRQNDNGVALGCPNRHDPSLLRTEYLDSEFRPCREFDGLLRYQNWIPGITELQDPGRTIVYHSQRLGKSLGMSNLWVAFNGYWPEQGAVFETCTFKELESYTVLARSPNLSETLTISSAGNTAAAFALACSRNKVPCLLLIPERGLARLKFRTPPEPWVKLVVLERAGYTDAIRFAEEVIKSPGFIPEGGAKNVGRRDGLATVMLSAFEAMERLPEYYFQGIGSGTGGIAVHEAVQRLRNTCARDDELPKLMLCQNKPFTPIYDAWRSGHRAWPEGCAKQFRSAIEQVHADELTNWSPPYSVHGGLHDALTESHGDVLVTDNASVVAARELFCELEGIDIEPAAGVAVACLRQSVADGLIPSDALVLLNITGGGRQRAASDFNLIEAEPQLRFNQQSLDLPQAVDQVIELCQT